MNTLRIIGFVIGYFAVVLLICQVLGMNRRLERPDEDQGPTA